MIEITVQVKCPQTDKPCVGKGKCDMDRSKGCALSLLWYWQNQKDRKMKTEVKLND